MVTSSSCMFSSLALAASVAIPLVTANIVSPSPREACNAIAATGIETLSSEVNFLSLEYIDAQSHYWSAANADLVPACAVFPLTARDVSQIVTILGNFTTVEFAVKSGGHNPNVGWSSVDGGVLISMNKIDSTVLSLDSKTADVGPGSRWLPAARALEPYNLTVVSGRLGDVGVAGLTLGGGLSFLSTQYGLVCDNVVNFEVVLANASIVDANATNNPDLFWALRGGGNQFGIVTKFTMKTHPTQRVWGGVRAYAATHAAALINATHDFNTNFKDPKAAVIVTGEIAIENLLQIFTVFFFYDGETPPPGVFDKFNAIPSFSDSVKVQSYADVLEGNDALNLYGLRYLIRGTTLPNLPSTTGQSLYHGHYQQWKEYVLTKGVLHPGFIFSLAFQPLPYLIPEQSIAAGGNALGMTPDSGDRMWMEYDVSWLTPLGDKDADTMARNITATVDKWAKETYGGIESTNYKGPADPASIEQAGYLPIFLNDAMYDQRPAQGYGDNGYERLKSIQKTVDPHGFFPIRTGGFKFT